MVYNSPPYMAVIQGHYSKCANQGDVNFSLEQNFTIFQQGCGCGSGSGSVRIRYLLKDPHPDPSSGYGSGSGSPI